MRGIRALGISVAVLTIVVTFTTRSWADIESEIDLFVQIIKDGHTPNLDHVRYLIDEGRRAGVSSVKIKFLEDYVFKSPPRTGPSRKLVDPVPPHLR